MPQNENETLRQQIDENLRRVYQEKLEEAIPDRFADLLRQLRQQETPKEQGQ